MKIPQHQRREALALFLSVAMLIMTPFSAVAQQGAPFDAPRYASSGYELVSKAELEASVSYLSKASSSEIWVIESRTSEDAPKAEGTFYVEQSLAWPNVFDTSQAPVFAESTAIQDVAAQLATGTMRRADGTDSFFAMMRFDVTYRSDGELVHESVLAAVAEGKTLDELEIFARQLVDAVRKGVTDLQALAVPSSKSNCEGYCEQDFTDRIAICGTNANACLAGVGAAAATCIAGCAILGPGAPPCLAAWLTAEALSVAACLLVQESCNREAGLQRRICLRDCRIGGS